MKPDAISKFETILDEERNDACMRGLQYVLDELDMITAIEPKSITKAMLWSEVTRVSEKIRNKIRDRTSGGIR